MKFAIRGHKSRGKEVIQILESLGGKNTEGLTGTYETFYYIDDKNDIGDDHKKNFPPTYKLYTLEEFEKEFPFKIGDEVSIAGFPNVPKTITKITWDCDEILYSFEGLNNTWFGAKALKKFEMKEERNITLTLDKAKEWYKKDGELREIALQAFTEKELTKVDLPKTWEEFCDNYPVKGSEATIGCDARIINCMYIEGRRRSYKFKDIMPSEQSAEAHLAMIQLEQLRNCWWGDWKPDWLEGNVQKYVIQKWRDRISIETTYVTHSFLSFPTYEMAKEFLECFRDLIEKAGDLI